MKPMLGTVLWENGVFNTSAINELRRQHGLGPIEDEWNAQFLNGNPKPGVPIQGLLGVVVTPESVANYPETLAAIKAFSKQARGKA